MRDNVLNKCSGYNAKEKQHIFTQRRHQSLLGSPQEKARKLSGSLVIPLFPHFTGSDSFGSLVFTKAITGKRHLSVQLPQQCTGEKG